MCTVFVIKRHNYFFGSFQLNMQHFILSHGTTTITEIICVILLEIQPVSDNFT